jgi:hypothetical protein
VTGSPTAFGKVIAEETEKWRKVVLAVTSKRNEPVLHWAQIFR